MDTMETLSLSDPALQDSQYTYEQEEAIRNQSKAAEVDVDQQETEGMEGEGGEEEALTSDEEIEPVEGTHDQNEEVYATKPDEGVRPNLKRLKGGSQVEGGSPLQVIESDEEAAVKHAKLEHKGVHKDRDPLGPLPPEDQSMAAVLAETEKKLEGGNVLEAQKKLRSAIRSEAQEQEEDDQKGYKDNESEEEGKEKKRKGKGKGKGKGKRKGKKGKAKDEKPKEGEQSVEERCEMPPKEAEPRNEVKEDVPQDWIFLFMSTIKIYLPLLRIKTILLQTWCCQDTRSGTIPEDTEEILDEEPKPPNPTEVKEVPRPKGPAGGKKNDATATPKKRIRKQLFPSPAGAKKKCTPKTVMQNICTKISVQAKVDAYASIICKVLCAAWSSESVKIASTISWNPRLTSIFRSWSYRM